MLLDLLILAAGQLYGSNVIARTHPEIVRKKDIEREPAFGSVG